MKETKKQRKRRVGMNAATLEAYQTGHRVPEFHDFAPAGSLPMFRKVRNGVPYVNPLNFRRV